MFRLFLMIFLLVYVVCWILEKANPRDNVNPDLRGFRYLALSGVVVFSVLWLVYENKPKSPNIPNSDQVAIEENTESDRADLSQALEKISEDEREAFLQELRKMNLDDDKEKLTAPPPEFSNLKLPSSIPPGWMYYYRDNFGKEHFTNQIVNIPSEFLPKTKVVQLSEVGNTGKTDIPNKWKNIHIKNNERRRSRYR